MKLHYFTSDQFKWKGTHGTAKISDILSNRHENISRFAITSIRTGQTRFYEIDTNAPGYEDGWDGEFKCYTDNLFDGTRITIVND